MRFAAGRWLIGAGLVSLVAARSGVADTHGWTLCTPGSFHSCHSVSLLTTPIMAGGSRTGTQVTISLTNLQGTAPQDNTAWSYLGQVMFWRNGPVAAFNSMNGSVGGDLQGAATGATSALFFSTDYESYPGTMAQIVGMRVGGCSEVGWIPAYTCGLGSAVSFSWSSSILADASDFSTVMIVANGDAQSNVGCLSDPSKYAATTDPSAWARCDVLAESTSDVVPEPASVVLLATGLLGIGAASRRRRTRGSGS